MSEKITAAVAKALLSEPWSPGAMLQRLVRAAEHLLHDHACDQDGYEEVSAVVQAAKAIPGGPVTIDAMLGELVSVVAMREYHTDVARVATQDLDNALKELAQKREEHAESLRRMRVALGALGVADCDDPIGVLEELAANASHPGRKATESRAGHPNDLDYPAQERKRVMRDPKGEVRLLIESMAAGGRAGLHAILGYTPTEVEQPRAMPTFRASEHDALVRHVHPREELEALTAALQRRERDAVDERNAAGLSGEAIEATSAKGGGS